MSSVHGACVPEVRTTLFIDVPCAHVAPVAPVAHVDHVAPVGPAGPVSPVGPIGPVAPVFPVSPFTHLKAVASACFSFILSSESIRTILSAVTIVDLVGTTLNFLFVICCYIITV